MNLPDLSVERKLWQDGYQIVIGADEVGRGAFAGPVVAGACALKVKSPVFSQKSLLEKIKSLGINDSKKLSSKKRELLSCDIKKYFHWGIGEVGALLIDKIGMVKSTRKAVRQAVMHLLFQVKEQASKNYQKTRTISPLWISKNKIFLLLDTFQVKYIPIVGLKHQKAVFKGDEKSITIAAASIIAKVYRDSLMQKLSLIYNKYHWDKNAGYGTKEHITALQNHGATPFHRLRFVKKWL